MPKWPWTFNKVHDTSPKNHQISPEISVLSLRDGVRAERLTPFCPNSNLSELIKYLFGFEVILFKDAKLDPNKILVFEHFFFFFGISRDFKISWLPKVIEMTLLIYPATLSRDLATKLPLSVLVLDPILKINVETIYLIDFLSLSTNPNYF